MKKRKITIGLSADDIDRAIRELDEYQKDLQSKIELLKERVAEELMREAESGFLGAVVDDLVSGGQRLAQVSVRKDERGSAMVVIADGADAVWVEFGAGVYHNGAPGSSPHPKGAELGMTIGGFGEGQGKKETWGFYEDGELYLTHGAPAVMPMERALTAVCNEISKLVEEVFK